MEAYPVSETLSRRAAAAAAAASEVSPKHSAHRQRKGHRTFAEPLTVLLVVAGAYALALSVMVGAAASLPPRLVAPLPLRLVLELACAAYLADVLSGTVHFTLDHANSGDRLRHQMPTDLTSARAAQDGAKALCNAWECFVWKFQVHHSLTWPRSLKSRSQSQVQIDALSLAFAALMAMLWRQGVIEHAWLFRTVVASAILATNVQRAHFWCHERTHSPQTLPSTVRWLQDAGLLLHPAWHRVHHETYDRHFPIFNGWSDRYCQALFHVCVACGIVDPAAGQKPTKIGPRPPGAAAAGPS